MNDIVDTESSLQDTHFQHLNDYEVMMYFARITFVPSLNVNKLIPNFHLGLSWLLSKISLGKEKEPDQSGKWDNALHGFCLVEFTLMQSC